MLAQVFHALWGLPQTLVGVALYAATAGCARTRFHTALVTSWELSSGMSLGMFVFVPREYPQPLLVHEYGHTVQSLVLGPLYLPLVGLPSLIWANMPALRRWREGRQMSYYAFPIERWASNWGERICGEPALR